MEGQPNTDNFDSIIRMFRYYDCDEQSLISKSKLIEILNKQANLYLDRNFNNSIIDQIWGQAQTTSKGEATVYTFSKIFAQALSILQDRVKKIEGPTGIKQRQSQLDDEQDKLKLLQGNYESGYQTNYQKINTCKKNIITLKNKLAQIQNNRADFRKQLNEINSCLTVPEKLVPLERTQYISKMQESIQPISPSTHLSIIFKICCLAICLQLLVLNFHKSFLTILLYTLIIFWLFIGYYDQNFVKSLITGLIISCLLDLTYLILEMLEKLGNYRYSGEKFWSYICMGIVLIEVALRIFLTSKLCIFRQPSKKRQYFILFGSEIELNARSGKMAFRNSRI